MASNFPMFHFNFPLFNENENKQFPDKEGEVNKSRFVSLTETDREKLLQDSEAKSTKYSTKWVVNIFKGKYYKNM